MDRNATILTIGITSDFLTIIRNLVQNENYFFYSEENTNLVLETSSKEIPDLILIDI